MESSYLNELDEVRFEPRERSRKRAIVDPVTSESEPGFLRYLKSLCEDTNALAEEAGIGKLEWKVVNLKANLYCVEVRFVEEDNDEDLPRFYVFAAGRFNAHDNRSISLVEVKRVDTERYVFISSDPNALLSVVNPPVV